MPRKNTFDLSVFQQAAAQAADVMDRMHESPDGVDLEPIYTVGRMLRKLKPSDEKWFEARLNDNAKETLLRAACTVKATYGPQHLRHFLGEVCGTVRNILDRENIDTVRRTRAHKFLQSVAHQ